MFNFILNLDQVKTIARMDNVVGGWLVEQLYNKAVETNINPLDAAITKVITKVIEKARALGYQLFGSTGFNKIAAIKCMREALTGNEQLFRGAGIELSEGVIDYSLTPPRRRTTVGLVVAKQFVEKHEVLLKREWDNTECPF